MQVPEAGCGSRRWGPSVDVIGVSSPNSTPRRGLWLGLILLLGFGIYAPSIGNGYPLDDRVQAKAMIDAETPNTMVAELRPVTAYFGSAYWAGRAAPDELYRPVTVYSYALVHAIFGSSTREVPWAQRTINVLLHVLATFLVYLLISRLVAGVPALVAAAVFAVHALHGEAIFAIVGRADLFAFCFGALAVLCLDRTLCRTSATGGRGRGLAMPALAGLCAFLAFCSKESALAWVPVGAVYLWLRARTAPSLHDAAALQDARDAGPKAARDSEPASAAPIRRSSLVAASLVAALPMIAFFVLRARMIADLPAGRPGVSIEANPLAHVDTVTRLLSSLTLLARGLGQSLLPTSNACYYGDAALPPVQSAADLSFLFGAVLLAVLAALSLRSAWVLFRGRGAPATESTYADVGSTTGSSADTAVHAGDVEAHSSNTLVGHALIALGGFAFLGFAFITSNLAFPIGVDFAERLYYAPSVIASCLAAWAMIRLTGKPRAMQALAVGLVAWGAWSCVRVVDRAGDWKSDATLYVNDVQTQPRSTFLLVNAGTELARQGRLDIAAGLFEEATKIRSTHVLAWANLGNARMQQGRARDAQAALQRAVSLEGDADHRALAHSNLAALHSRNGRWSDALREAKAASALVPQSASYKRDVAAIKGWLEQQPRPKGSRD